MQSIPNSIQHPWNNSWAKDTNCYNSFQDMQALTGQAIRPLETDI